MKLLKGITALVAAFALIGIAAAFTANAQLFSKGTVGNGQIAKRVFKLADFQVVSASSGIDLYLEPSSKCEAAVVTDKNVLDLIEVEQRGNAVIFSLKERVRRTSAGIKVYLSFKTLEGIKVSGGSDVFMANSGAVVKGDKLSLTGSGGISANLKLDVAKFSCDISGGCDIVAAGKATSFNLEMSGGCVVKAKDLITESCSIRGSGGTDATVTATKSISTAVSGGADVSYYGNPEKVSISKSGGASVNRK